jgi:hypothetical protein
MNLPLKSKILWCFALIYLCSNASYCQVVINEIAPSNISLIKNSNGEFDDWIELYNTGATYVNLEGYGLSDDHTSPYKFQFPSIIIPAGQSLIVFASDTNIEAINHFEMAVNGWASWKYTLGSQALDTNWRNLSFNDASWLSGNGGIGFSDDDDSTIIDPSVSLMMRKTFTVSDTSRILNAIFRMDYDDGFVAYLNGVEIGRSNMATYFGRPNWDELAFQPHEAQMFQGMPSDSFYLSHDFLKAVLRQGTNVLSVETHDRVVVSTDMSSLPFLFFGVKDNNYEFPAPPSLFHFPSSNYYSANFKLSRSGEIVYLTDPLGIVLDQVHYTNVEADNSYGRIPDGSSNWCYLGEPTPNLTNNNSVCYSGYSTVPIFSKVAGRYQSSISLSLSTSFPSGIIRYTTNGDEPNLFSHVYFTPLTFTKTTTIRARVFANGSLPSPVVTNTYFIDADNHLSVFNIATDSLNLWDENTGIYTLGPNADSISPFYGANYWQPWAKPASIEYFDKTGNRIINFNADIEIYGNYSRGKPQKSFEIKLSDKYGIDDVHYTFIPEKPFISKYDRLILRNGGTDYNKVHFRDPLMQRLMKNSYCGTVASEPVVMHLNGAFWGVYWLTEKYNHKWVETNYGYEKEEFNFLDEIGSQVVVGNGDDEKFMYLYEYATNQNPSTPEYYYQVKSMLDLENFADYFIANTYYNNGDWIGEWTNNLRMWNAKHGDTRIKYLLIDTDFGFGLKGDVTDNRLSAAIDPQAICHSSDIFDALLDNSTFKTYFINRYADLINTIFDPVNVEREVKQVRDSIVHDMAKHFEKWGGDTIDWNTDINDMMLFVNQRPTIARDHIMNEFGLSGEVILTLNTVPAGSGKIQISTITPQSYPWSGTYFNGNPVRITAIPNPGYSFSHWSSTSTINPNDSSQSTVYNFSFNDQITAFFTGSPAPVKLTVSEINYNSHHELNVGDWIELHNYGNFNLDISGWKISDENEHHSYIFPVTTAIPANGYVVIPKDSIKFREYYPHVLNRTGQMEFNLENNGEQIQIFNSEGQLYLSFVYSDQAPWPLEPDGNGYTCELMNPNGILDNGNNWFSGCFGGSPGSAFSTVLSMPLNISGSTQFCSGQSTQLSALNVSLFSYRWMLNDNTIPQATGNLYSAATPGLYSVFIDAQGCSAISPALVIEELPNETEPVTSNGSRCFPGEVILYASAADSIYWYDAPNGMLVAIGDKFVTPRISQTTVYYARSGYLCPSDEVEVTASVVTDNCSDYVDVYPNPSSTNSFKLQSDHLVPGEASVIVNTMSGNIVLDRTIEIIETGVSREMEFVDLEAGVYIISVFQNEKKLIAKYIKL